MRMRSICHRPLSTLSNAYTLDREQIKSCMEKSDWRRYLDNEKDEKELQRFIDQFFPCFRDANGNSYFQAN